EAPERRDERRERRQLDPGGRGVGEAVDGVPAQARAELGGERVRGDAVRVEQGAQAPLDHHSRTFHTAWYHRARAVDHPIHATARKVETPCRDWRRLRGASCAPG